MSKRNIFILFAICFLLIASTANVSAYQKREIIKKKFDFPVRGSLRLHNRNGDIIIRSWDKEIVDMRAVKWVNSYNKRRVESFFSRLKININKTSKRLSIEVEYPKNRSNLEFKVDFELYVPKEIYLDVYSRNGEVEIEEIEGGTKVSTRNGNIDLKHIKGKMEINSRNGHIELTDVYGPLRAETRNDDIIISFLQAPLEGKVKVYTRNGRIKITFPPGFSADIFIASENGSINTHFPIEITGKITKGRLEGTINKGGVPVRLETRNGNIDIYKY